MEVASHTGFMLQTMLFMVNHPWNNSLYRAIHNVPNTNTDEGSRCYGIYGCFSFDYPWVSERRPLVYPRSPEELGVRFSVYNKHAQNSPKYVDLDDPDGIPQLGIESEGMLYVIGHDHISAGGEPWVHRLVRALLQNDTSGTASVLTIDWRRTSPLGNLQHVSDSRLVGAITARTIHMIYTETGMQNLDKVHLLGHSLGAHLCGYVGYYLQKDFGLRLGRITGMDPVVEMFADTDPIVRLDNSDAKFVDVIHTHAIWYQSIGHVDFYPTGGHPHLGCDESTHTTQLGLRCNYMSSPELYLNAFQRRCSSVAIGCQSLERFLAGDCFECNEDGHYCIEFGPNAWNSYRGLIENGVMTVPGQVRAFMITADHSPYCRSHFKVTLLVSNDVESRVLGPEIGTLAVELVGKHRERFGSMDLSQKPLHFEPGQNYSAVVSGMDVGIPKRVLLFWQYNENRRQSVRSWRVRKMPRIYVEYIVVQSLEHRSRQKFCPPNREPVTAVNEDYTRDRLNEFREEYCK